MDNIKLNACGLLEECLYNGSQGKDTLYAWFLGECEIIEQTVNDLNEDLTEE
jgi:hypothetical protein